ncbi:MAG: hypothetical protein A2043_10110 [Candidatus Schekmanbacteria bacterium GWA2_38_9]|uniref:Membrane protein insertase YidC n=1 Tax=Candidatus Schekmanbacteria bacterium RIFCSPLOWO2_12_FULL_38_15 TaxID=1817883 RepID=A0A1F7SK45_9BACT|nr:MAG: hypothetical protein A2043_10110 [Candidatus Schekmanbacteria bacterium GWA2_38_9]OGL48305.1 MAG: hypothetical protein A3H37_00105 [Candidatus Schekmanbacteria bacterium RIFCSPLOWO2_02_FULL_38_14]OGL54141.1 MAG: hypothetical protein A3G31_05085 [Candidatus Schekmanbacteria bacterium RIFCSPLOWO2_12_FULL_38_15]
MQIRLVVFIVLSLLLITTYQYLFMPQQENLGKNGKISEGAKSSVKDSLPQPESIPLSKENILKTITSPYPVQNQETIKDDFIKVDTELYTARFSKRKAVLEELVLEKYKDASGKGVRLIGKEKKDENSRTLDFALNQNSSSQRLIFDADKKLLSLNSSNTGGVINFISIPDASGLKVTKSLKFNNSSYLINMHIEVENLSESPASFSSQIFLGPSFYLGGADESNAYGHFGPLIKNDGKVIREQTEKIKEPLIFSNGNVEWVGLESKYFLASIMPEEEKTAGFMLNDKNKKSLVGIQTAVSKIKGRERLSRNYSVYIGPKEFNSLKALKLENAIDFGWFGVVGIPLLKALNFFNLYLKNYGLTIILITFIIKILFIPFTQKSFKSMQAMQKLQPQIKALKERYKKEPQKLNQETMELYKKHKVNPVGGCLPMVFQIPVFIAFYNVLMNSIELRGAPFFLWISDLSAKDPYYVTPIIMGITMFAQQKMSPTTADPKQAQIMLIMPVIFTFMFMSFPTGLVLYWTVNNILTIGQQYFIMGKFAAKETDDEKGKNRKKKNNDK